MLLMSVICDFSTDIKERRLNAGYKKNVSAPIFTTDINQIRFYLCLLAVVSVLYIG